MIEFVVGRIALTRLQVNDRGVCHLGDSTPATILATPTIQAPEHSSAMLMHSQFQRICMARMAQITQLLRVGSGGTSNLQTQHASAVTVIWQVTNPLA